MWRSAAGFQELPRIALEASQALGLQEPTFQKGAIVAFQKGGILAAFQKGEILVAIQKEWILVKKENQPVLVADQMA